MLHILKPRAKVSLRLEGVYEGARNDSLFEVCRQWAYRQRRGNDLGAWIAGVRDFFFFNNKRFPDPMHVSEVRRRPTAWQRGSGASSTRSYRARPRGRWIIPASLNHGVALGRARPGDEAHHLRRIAGRGSPWVSLGPPGTGG